MAKGKGGAPAPAKKSGADRQNGKAYKKFIKVFDQEKKRLVRVPNPNH
jgi:hypothetical protein